MVVVVVNVAVVVTLLATDVRRRKMV